MRLIESSDPRGVGLQTTQFEELARRPAQRHLAGGMVTVFDANSPRPLSKGINAALPIRHTARFRNRRSRRRLDISRPFQTS